MPRPPAPPFNSFIIKDGLVYLFLSRGRRTGDKYAGQKTVIDLADLEECLSHHWYAVQSEGTFRAYFPTGGSLPSFLTGIPMTCHLDGDKLNNRRNNLSLSSPKRGQENSHRSRRSRKGPKPALVCETRRKWYVLRHWEKLCRCRGKNHTTTRPHLRV